MKCSCLQKDSLLPWGICKVLTVESQSKKIEYTNWFYSDTSSSAKFGKEAI